jgi:hypothetical protein
LSEPQSAVSPPAEVRGFLEVRDKDGNLKGRIPFIGSTHLSEEELRRRLLTLPSE